MNIQSHYVVVLKRIVSFRQIIRATKTPLKWYTVAGRFNNNIFMIYIYSDPVYWVRAMNNYMCSLIICSWSDIFDNIVMTEKKGYCTEQSFTILICSAKILTRRRMSKLVSARWSITILLGFVTFISFIYRSSFYSTTLLNLNMS